MTRIEDSVIIEAPVDAVFGYVSDWRRWSDWFDGLSGVRPTSEVTRGSGARYRYSVRVMGFPAMVETEVRDFVEGRSWTGVGTGGLPHRTHWLFEAQDQSTRFTYTLEYRVPVPLLGAALDALVVRREWRGILRRSLSNVREHFLRSVPAPVAAGERASGEP